MIGKQSITWFSISLSNILIGLFKFFDCSWMGKLYYHLLERFIMLVVGRVFDGGFLVVVKIAWMYVYLTNCCTWWTILSCQDIYSSVQNLSYLWFLILLAWAYWRLESLTNALPLHAFCQNLFLLTWEILVMYCGHKSNHVVFKVPNLTDVIGTTITWFGNMRHRINRS